MSSSPPPSSPDGQPDTSYVGPPCPDLLAIAGGRYRVGTGPAHVAEQCGRSQTVDRWLLIVPSRFGHVFPWGRDRLALSTNGRGAMAQKLAALPFARVEQDGADGFTISFDVTFFDEVSTIARPKRIRKLSAEHKSKLAAASQAFRFAPSSRGSNRTFFERNATKSVPDDSGHVQAHRKAVA